MYPQNRQPSAPFGSPLSPGRLLILTLTYLTAAMVTCSLAPLLPPTRYVLMPADTAVLPGCLSGLTDKLPGVLAENVAQVSGVLRGMAVEMLFWGLAVAMPTCPWLAILLSLWRGGCAGVVLSLVTAESGAMLVGSNFLTLLCPLAVTVVLFLYVAGQGEQRHFGRFLRFAGVVFALTLTGNLLF